MEKYPSFTQSFQPQQLRSYKGLDELSTEFTGPTTTKLINNK